MERYREIRTGEKGAWLSLGAYVFLSVLKLVVGYASDSEALTADGLNNTTDILATVAILIGLKISRKPPDEDHPYGHFRAQTIASLIVSFIMAGVGIEVLIQAMTSIVHGGTSVPNMMAAWTALFSAVLIFAVHRYNLRLARQIDNHAIMAAAKDNLSDALVSIGAFVGVLGSWLGLTWLDPVAAVVVGLMIVKTAWGIFFEASHTLTDGFEEQRLAHFKKTILQTPGVEAIKDVRARKHGSLVLVDVTVQVDPELNVVESHCITEAIEEKMNREHRIDHVHVHIEPKQ
ncbi:cation diffusion facilitator family transporter [Ferviditalea candida]|uniref:Cation diffusion facilitator family transporter n=1 Tax=Ferviditalea candida TaxID=3108399 RepID=A0ABU5ZIJ2_9BACL|nr:cation diffusion facilitator family transporter [Paenibacillaceae bacterium T2]